MGGLAGAPACNPLAVLDVFVRFGGKQLPATLDEVIVWRHVQHDSEGSACHAFLANVRGADEVAGVLEELRDEASEEWGSGAGGNTHCFSHAYRVTDEERQVVREHHADEGRDSKGVRSRPLSPNHQTDS